MQYLIHETRQYRKTLKKLSRSKRFKQDELNRVINTLAEGDRLLAKYQDHALSGKLKSFRECHIAFDLLLVYQLQDEKLILVLVNIGSHTDLFGG